MSFRTRFAPSPTGPLHLGHAFSAMLAHDMAQRQGGTFLLRIEDIDRSRSRTEWENQIFDDLSWLGLDWPQPVMRQSDRLDRYHMALRQLWGDGLLYPCTCTRRDISSAVTAPQEGMMGPDGLIYPGTCRSKPRLGEMPDNVALRLDMQLAMTWLADTSLGFTERGAGPDGQTGQITLSQDRLINGVGDIVLARRDMGTSYHLSVVVDDAEQGITCAVRGGDLFEATQIHVVLQHLLSLPVPAYHHHRLIRDEVGKRLAKRDDARALSLYRAQGATPDNIREMVGLSR